MPTPLSILMNKIKAAKEFRTRSDRNQFNQWYRKWSMGVPVEGEESFPADNPAEEEDGHDEPPFEADQEIPPEDTDNGGERRSEDSDPTESGEGD